MGSMSPSSLNVVRSIGMRHSLGARVLWCDRPLSLSTPFQVLSVRPVNRVRRSMLRWEMAPGQVIRDEAAGKSWALGARIGPSDAGANVHALKPRWFNPSFLELRTRAHRT